jgi:hypothetical protein
MKNTTGLKKSASNGQNTKVHNYHLALVLVCAGLAALWYAIFLSLSLGLSAVLNTYSFGNNNQIFNFLISNGTFLLLFIASALSLPFAVAAYKRLKVEKPVVSAIAFFMAIVFGLTLFMTASSIFYFGEGGIYAVALSSILLTGLASILLTGVVYGFAIRRLKHRLSNGLFLCITIGIAVTPVILWHLWLLWAKATYN